MGSMSMVHWMVVIGVVVLLFGRGKISALMGDVAEGIKSFKKGMSDEPAAVKPAGSTSSDTVSADQVVLPIPQQLPPPVKTMHGEPV